MVTTTPMRTGRKGRVRGGEYTMILLLSTGFMSTIGSGYGYGICMNGGAYSQQYMYYGIQVKCG